VTAFEWFEGEKLVADAARDVFFVFGDAVFDVAEEGGKFHTI
jgi:hypothetical protein